MALFIAGLAIFFGAHFFSAFRRRGEGALDQTIGPKAYRGLFAVVSFLGLGLMIYGFGEVRGTIPVWDPPDWTRHVVLLLMLPALILLVAAECPPGYIRRATKHPMLAGIKIWAFSHLLANGDLASILMFGAFLAFAVIDRIAVKKRSQEMAAAQAKGDVIAVVVGLALYVVIAFYAHEWLIGVPVVY